MIHIEPHYFVLPGVLSVLAAIFEGVGFALMVPLVNGLISGDFKSLGTTPVIGVIISRFFSLFGDRHSSAFVIMLILVLGSTLLKNLFRYYAVTCSYDFVRRFADNLRRKLYERYLGFGKLYFDANNAGHLYQVLMGMSERVAIELKALESAFYALVLMLVYLIVMAYISLPLAVIATLIFPAIYLSLRALMVRIKRSSNHFAVLYMDLGAKISNTLSCMPLIKAQGDEEKEKEWFADASDRARRAQLSIDKKQALNAPLQETIMLLVVLVIVGVMAHLSTRAHHANVAGYMVFFVILRRASTNLTIFGNVIVSFAGITGPIHEISRVLDSKDKYVVPDGRVEFVGLKSKIEVKDLHYAFPHGSPVLKGIRTSFVKGSSTALVGSSGGGKTTLINMLMRFYDSEPSTIFIDGEDIRQLKISSLRSKIALVSQESYLFNESLRFNLAYGLSGTVSDETILAALDKSRLTELIGKLPRGLDAIVGDRGVKLSGGEKQRVSIARAILKGAEIVMLDEATSALDSVNEKLIQEALNELMKGKTTIVVAHRLSTIQHADKVIVLEEGQIVEEGSPQELLQKKGKFFQYWQGQVFY